MLSLRHYMIFSAIAETGSFTGAARKLYITQSAVSHAIREMEDYTGTILFDRLSRQVQITAGGKHLLEEITPILTACESLDKRMGQLDSAAPIHIVSSITIAAFWLPQFLLAFRKQAPDIPVFVTVVSAAEAIRILQSGNADLAFAEGARPQGPFCCTRFADYSLKILCSPEYPAAHTIRTVSSFCAEALLLREPGSAIRDTLDSKLLLLGHTIRPAWVSVNSTTLIEAAKAGLGITVLPEVLVTKELSGETLISLDIEGLSLSNELFTIWHKDKQLSPSLRKLLACIPGFNR